MKKSMLLSCLIFSGIFFCLSARSLYVNSIAGNDDYPGKSVNEPFRSFSKCLLEAHINDTIYCFGEFSVSNPLESYRMSFTGFEIGTSLTVIGGDPSCKTVIQADPVPRNYESRVITIFPCCDVQLSNLEIRNGFLNSGIESRGAGIYCFPLGSLKLDNCLIADNVIETFGFEILGAALYTESYPGMPEFPVSINSCEFRNNVLKNIESIPDEMVESHGGVGYFNCSDLKISNSSFIGNESCNNAAVLALINSGSSIINCNFLSNMSLGSSITIRDPSRPSLFMNCTATGNIVRTTDLTQSFIKFINEGSEPRDLHLKNNVFYGNYSGSGNRSCTLIKSGFLSNYVDHGYNYMDEVPKSQEFDEMMDDLTFVLEYQHNTFSEHNPFGELNVCYSQDGRGFLNSKWNSPLVDAGNADAVQIEGESIPVPEIDFLGRTRRNAPDIGSVEYTVCTWNGRKNTLWNQPENWQMNLCPLDDHEDIVIPNSTNPPLIPGSLSCNKLDLGSGIELEIDEYDSLNINELILNADSIQATGISINGSLIFKKEKNVWMRLTLYPDKWRFLSFPFHLSADKFRKADRKTTLNWGDPLDYNSSADFFVASYDGIRRARENSSNGNWTNVTDHVLLKNQGYIMSTEKKIEIWINCMDLVTNTEPDSILVQTYNHDFASTIENRAWNLAGNPFLHQIAQSSFMVDQGPFYKFNGYNYDTYAFCDTLTLKSLDCFFVQSFESRSIPFYNNSLNQRILNSPLENSMVPCLQDEFHSLGELELTIANGNTADKTRIYFDKVALSEFETGRDAFKLFSPYPELPQIYTRIQGIDCSFSYVPEDSETIDVLIKIPGEGNYELNLSGRASTHGNHQFVLQDDQNCVILWGEDSRIIHFKKPGLYQFQLKQLADLATNTHESRKSAVRFKMIGQNLILYTDKKIDAYCLIHADGRIISSTEYSRYAEMQNEGMPDDTFGNSVRELSIPIPGSGVRILRILTGNHWETMKLIV